MEYYIRRGRSYFLNAAGKPNIWGKILIAIIIIVVAKILVIMLKKFVDKTMEQRKKANPKLNARRQDTIAGLIKQVLKLLVYFYSVLMILDKFSIDTKSILATAGVGGVAIGFGAQSLVKDVIAGFFVLQENSYVVGDYVVLQGFQGYVEEMNVRITRIRALTGELYTLPNGYITEITNMSRGSQVAVSMFAVGYDDNMDKAIEVLTKMCEDIKVEYRDILTGGPQVDGVEALEDSSYIIRVSGMAITARHWQIQKAMNKMGKEYLSAAGIEVPYPKVVVKNSENF